MTLEDKLREILQTPHRDSAGSLVMTFPTTKTLAQIKRAFADAGYVKLDKRQYRDPEGKPYTQYTLGHPQFSEFVRVPQFSYMTGREAYKRLEGAGVSGRDLDIAREVFGCD